MELKVNNTAQKLRGGFYTPIKISDFIIKWAFRDLQPANILEPSCGDGIFIYSLKKNVGFSLNNIKCKAIELTKSEADKTKILCSEFPSFEVINDDFFSIFDNKLKDKRFDLIIGNPPYIRYQYLTPEQRENQAKILIYNGMKPNKLINSWVSFMVASVQILDNKGKIGMVIPVELLQVAYAKELRLFLVKNLSKITIVTFEELIFPNVQQEVLLFLGEKDIKRNGSCKIDVIEAKNLDCLCDDFYNAPEDYKKINHNYDKWTKYFLTNKEIELINVIRLDSRFRKFSDIAKIDIGITTGNNKYFSVTQETVDKYKLHEVVLPLIGRSSHADGLYYTYDDWKKNAEKGAAAQLIKFPNIPYDEYPKEHKAYIKKGEELEVHKGYKCSIRDRWYIVPSVWVPDAFLLRRNYVFPKFVLNAVGAVSTDTMHRINFIPEVNHKKILLSYYNSITFAFTEIESRSYGGGVLEVLPGELENVLLPCLDDIDEDLVDELVNKIDQALRAKDNIEPILDEVDKKLLVDHLCISYDIVYSFRSIWKKLMNRRHIRKRS